MGKIILKHLCAASALAGSIFGVSAQQLHEEISVDGRYVPDVIRIDRINFLPKPVETRLNTRPMEYESHGVAASFIPSMVAMPATGWRATRTISSNRGYLEAGTGSWLNSTLSAGYRFLDNSTSLFGVRLQHNSTSLWKPAGRKEGDDTRQYRYDEALGLYGSHVFKGVGQLDAALDYHVGSFNYYGYLPSAVTPENENTAAPGQTINDVAFRATWHPLQTAGSTLRWETGVRMRHFAYRQLILPDGTRCQGGRETDIGLDGSLRLPWDNGNSIGVDGSLDILTPNLHSDYALLTITPYYRFTRGLLDIRAGIDVDLSFNAGEKGDRYPFIHLSPDIRIGLQQGWFGAFLDLTGGTQATTLPFLHELDYYGIPSILSTRPIHTPLDATFGINLGPFSGFSAGVEARWRSNRGVPLGGWYMAWLSQGDTPVAGLTPAEGGTPMYCSPDARINIHGASFGGRLSYEWGETLALRLKGSWQPQDGRKGFFNGYDRPRVTLNASATVRPVKRLTLTAGYDYRGVRRIYTMTEPLPEGLTVGGYEPVLQSLRLPDLTLLNFSAAWNFTDDFSVWLQGDNLLGRHDQVLPMQPTQGVVVTAGVKWLF